MTLKTRERKLKVYTDSYGKQPFNDWYHGLKDRLARLTITRRLDRVALGNFGDCKSIGQGVYELRIFLGPGYRIYFSEWGQEIVLLLCGGDKSSQKEDIKKAQSYFKDYQERYG